MSILIKGMEMPKSCWDCYFQDCGNCILNSHKAVDKNIVEDRRDEACPLVNIPPHGRLGDIDKLIERLERQVDLHEKQAKRAEEKGTAGYTNDMYIVDRNRDLIGILKALSVVIPAEKAEKAEKAEEVDDFEVLL